MYLAFPTILRPATAQPTAAYLRDSNGVHYLCLQAETVANWFSYHWQLAQRKVVNIHRLIMHAALEEEVMSLQKSKVTFADDVIDAENAILKTMNTDQLLNLFCFFTNRSNGNDVSEKTWRRELQLQAAPVDPKPVVDGKGLEAILSGLGFKMDIPNV
ncbi:SNF2 family N-terminal domain [Musa troglodytarum]|uniref:SNF2 family N-terminal domain n=1 Tax=Musa troglodytarum TaxID=320322 RepID=A0A9E7FZM4_9LILI|nr:SNF2 family N-terminal domain [Musa troglodytarum]URE04845.1 SNF2 family N-terminal domain [Musa troglodytarum]